jgi:hypothetical protein
MSDAGQSFDLYRALTENAERLNAASTPAPAPRVFYEIMSGSLVWSDEMPKEMPGQGISALRFLFAYRTGLIRNKPRDEFKAVWDLALALFPNWVGFRSERRQATPELLRIYRRGAASLRKCLRDLERRMDPQSKEDGEPSDAPDRGGE